MCSNQRIGILQISNENCHDDVCEVRGQTDLYLFQKMRVQIRKTALQIFLNEGQMLVGFAQIMVINPSIAKLFHYMYQYKKCV